MTPLIQKYEEFGNDPISSDQSVDNRLEAEKIRSFEDGYKAGWEDAVEAQTKNQKKLTSGLTNNLQEISFGYHEARNSLLQELRPLFEAIGEKFLPEIGRSSLGPIIAEEIQKLGKEQCDHPIEIVTSSADFDFLKELLEDVISDPFTLSSDQGLAEGQVFLRLGAIEKEIDFEKLILEIRRCIENLFEQESSDG
jgi:flagellar biosynthesis/type III secretory pathway protein FliH